MPKQGRRWTLFGGRPVTEVLDGPELEPTEELEVIEVAALEGLAESFERTGDRRNAEFESARRKVADRELQAHLASQAGSFRAAAKEVRNLIEQGGAK